MNQLDPRPRRRGYFLDPEAPDGEGAESESAEGFVVRLRIVRPLRKQASMAARPVDPRRAASRRRTDEARQKTAPLARDRS